MCNETPLTVGKGQQVMSKSNFLFAYKSGCGGHCFHFASEEPLKRNINVNRQLVGAAAGKILAPPQSNIALPLQLGENCNERHATPECSRGLSRRRQFFPNSTSSRHLAFRVRVGPPIFRSCNLRGCHMRQGWIFTAPSYGGCQNYLTWRGKVSRPVNHDGEA